MARWLEPRSRAGRIGVQIILLLVAAGLVFLLVTWLGSGLGESGR